MSQLDENQRLFGGRVHISDNVIPYFRSVTTSVPHNGLIQNPSTGISLDIHPKSIRKVFERSRGDPWIGKMIKVDLIDHKVIYEMGY
jgi:hypothetical protein